MIIATTFGRLLYALGWLLVLVIGICVLVLSLPFMAVMQFMVWLGEPRK